MSACPCALASRAAGSVRLFLYARGTQSGACWLLDGLRACTERGVHDKEESTGPVPPERLRVALALGPDSARGARALALALCLVVIRARSHSLRVVCSLLPRADSRTAAAAHERLSAVRAKLAWWLLLLLWPSSLWCPSGRTVAS